jgi:hypothetical protein
VTFRSRPFPTLSRRRHPRLRALVTDSGRHPPAGSPNGQCVSAVEQGAAKALGRTVEYED